MLKGIVQEIVKRIGEVVDDTTLDHLLVGTMLDIEGDLMEYLGGGMAKKASGGVVDINPSGIIGIKLVDRALPIGARLDTAKYTGKYTGSEDSAAKDKTQDSGVSSDEVTDTPNPSADTVLSAVDVKESEANLSRGNIVRPLTDPLK